ncbi:hypothetical protein EVAR_75132_1 [Eumeta japonica]|uniref:Uncharacterized protein n=1 Tax=Eumeta variegata TaxID=151549 RepID=A0A4C1U0N4_EUMVA|nr:hypothetical protein EVAR_75132_1 [Eumeta japonica]
MTFRGAAWETIEQAGEDWKSLHQLCRRLLDHQLRMPVRQDGNTPICRKENGIWQSTWRNSFTLPSDTHQSGIAHVQVRRVEEFRMARCRPPLPGDYFVSPAELADDFPTAEAEGSGTRRDPDCCHKTAA